MCISAELFRSTGRKLPEGLNLTAERTNDYFPEESCLGERIGDWSKQTATDEINVTTAFTAEEERQKLFWERPSTHRLCRTIVRRQC